MLGEIRDEETAKMAVRAAITGHKVYSTIHTKSPKEVYFRLEEMGIKNYLIRDALVGIVSQRLVRILCDKCKVKVYDLNLNEEIVPIYKRGHCEYCNKTGYKGRTIVASVNVIDKEMKNRLKDLYENNGMLSNHEMIESLYELLKKGSISYEDYLDFLEGEELNET